MVMMLMTMALSMMVWLVVVFNDEAVLRLENDYLS